MSYYFRRGEAPGKDYDGGSYPIKVSKRFMTVAEIKEAMGIKSDLTYGKDWVLCQRVPLKRKESLVRSCVVIQYNNDFNKAIDMQNTPEFYVVLASSPLKSPEQQLKEFMEKYGENYEPLSYSLWQ